MEEENKSADPISDSSPIVGHIREKFHQSETSRLYDERRWLKAYRNYRGLYGPEMAFRTNEKSRVFVKITKTKVLAAFGQIIEVLFSGGKFPLGISPTPVPEDIAEYAHLKQQASQQPQQPQDPYGFKGDGREIPPGATADMLMKNLAQEYENVGFDEGPANAGEPQIEPAGIGAKNLEKLIHDQLEESEAITTLRHVFFEMCLLGTGILKGPFSFDKEYHSFEEQEDTSIYIKKIKSVPKIEAVSCWNFYADPNATNISDCDYAIQRHSLNRQQFSDLRKMPFFNEEMIDDCLEEGPNYQVRGYESSLYNRETVETIYKNRYEVLEYWGIIDKDLAKQ